MTWFLKSAHSVLAKKIINQTVDFVGGSVLVSEMWDSWVQPVQRFAAGSLAMRSYSGMERQSAAATRIKNNRQIHMVSCLVMHGDDWIWLVNIGDAWWCMVMHGDGSGG